MVGEDTLVGAKVLYAVDGRERYQQIEYSQYARVLSSLGVYKGIPRD
jgi:hypothetical protein